MLCLMHVVFFLLLISRQTAIGTTTDLGLSPFASFVSSSS